MNEATIRDIVAADLSVIDPKLILVATEHEVVLPDKRRSAIDILAKDRFGCFTIIEIKKSNQTARSAVQQLYKYAAFLKRKNRLRAEQIRCIVASTHWDELNAPFSEFKKYSEYDSFGVKINLNYRGGYSIDVMNPPFELGGGEPLNNFIFFEFTSLSIRDEVLEKFLAAIKREASRLSSVVIKVEYSGLDVRIRNRFGFSWTVFRASEVDIEHDISTLASREKVSGDYFNIHTLVQTWNDGTLEGELRELILCRVPLFLKKEGEFTGLAIHSLNNTLSTWKICDTFLIGPMFDDRLYTSDEATSLACGFLGAHPYNFVCKITPDRPAQFNFARREINKFLANNNRWKKGMEYIVSSTDSNDDLSISIYNPLNFSGVLIDLYRYGKTERIPRIKLNIETTTLAVTYFGTVIWNGIHSPFTFRNAIRNAYCLLSEATASSNTDLLRYAPALLR